MHTLDGEIRKAIKEVYHKEYNKQLRIKHIKPIGWKVILGMNHPEHPIIISAELPDDKFIKFFKQELHDRHLDYIEYDEGYQLEPYHCPPDPKCTECDVER